MVGTLTFAPEIYDVKIFPAVYAEVKMYTAMGVDYGNEYESPEIVKLRARDKAIKNAVKQAGVYLKTYSRSVDNELTDDEITAITSNSYELVGEVKYNRVIKQVSDQITLIVWEATVDVNVDDGEITKWVRRDDRERSALISQTRESNEAAAENERKIDDLRQRANNVTDDAGRAQLKAEFDANDSEFLSNQKVEEANRALYEGNHDAAIKLYTEAIELKPDNAAAYNGRGTAYTAQAAHKQAATANLSAGKKFYLLAVDDLNKAIRLKPDYSEAYGNRGFVYHLLNDYSKAVKDFNRAIELDPTNAQNYIYRASYYSLVAKNNERALADYNKAIELEPNSGHCYSVRGHFYKKSGNYARAIEDYTKAIQIEKQDAMLAMHCYSRGECYKETEMYAKAIEDFTRAIELGSREESTKILLPWMYHDRAECYEAVGDTARAQADMKKYKELS